MEVVEPTTSFLFLLLVDEVMEDSLIFESCFSVSATGVAAVEEDLATTLSSVLSRFNNVVTKVAGSFFFVTSSFFFFVSCFDNDGLRVALVVVVIGVVLSFDFGCFDFVFRPTPPSSTIF